MAVNDVRVRVLGACRDLGWSLRMWQDSEELLPLLATVRLVPDGCFQIQRLVNGEVKTAGFFLRDRTFQQEP
ncbi:MAG: hypothetical protein EPO21_02190 [Chloroflexota bacterium]|nr:MAG: hypothetical protein EPO21_02190 [Chloroflexota bacterium]